ncbi:MAG: hypothetical protein R3F46_14515 [bacterium]
MGYTQLTQEERYQIDRRRAVTEPQGHCRELGRHKSTISRELRRNPRLGGVTILLAHRNATLRRHGKGRPRIAKKDWQRVKRLLREEHSPEQIRALRLVREGLSRQPYMDLPVRGGRPQSRRQTPPDAAPPVAAGAGAMAAAAAWAC